MQCTLDAGYISCLVAHYSPPCIALCLSPETSLTPTQSICLPPFDNKLPPCSYSYRHNYSKNVHIYRLLLISLSVIRTLIDTATVPVPCTFHASPDTQRTNSPRSFSSYLITVQSSVHDNKLFHHFGTNGVHFLGL
jgi:hypothetical protein